MKLFLRTPLPPIAARMSFSVDDRTPVIAARIDFEDDIGVTSSAAPRRQTEVTVLPTLPEDDTGLDIGGHRSEASAAASVKAPKPNGEPGRPGSGGYNLETTLLGWRQWSKVVYDQVVVSLFAIDVDGVI